MKTTRLTIRQQKKTLKGAEGNICRCFLAAKVSGEHDFVEILGSLVDVKCGQKQFGWIKFHNNRTNTCRRFSKFRPGLIDEKYPFATVKNWHQIQAHGFVDEKMGLQMKKILFLSFWHTHTHFDNFMELKRCMYPESVKKSDKSWQRTYRVTICYCFKWGKLVLRYSQHCASGKVGWN